MTETPPSQAIAASNDGTPRVTRHPSAPRPVMAAVGCILAVVAIGILSATFILLTRRIGNQLVPLLIGQTITVIIPGVLAASIARGNNRSRWLFIALTAIGVTLRGFGLADSIADRATLNTIFQASSIMMSLSAVALLVTQTARIYFTRAPIAAQ